VISQLANIDFSVSNKLPILLQTEITECGLTCLAMVLNYHGHKINLNKLREKHNVSQHGTTLLDLMGLAEKLNLGSRPVKLGLDSMSAIQCPAILHWNMDHFVVLKKVTVKGLFIHDPSSGLRMVTFEQADSQFTGIALELTPLQSFTKKSEIESIALSDLWNNASGLKSSLTNILLLSFILQVFSLALPFYSQIIFDDVLVTSDYGLLTVLAIGFLLLQIMNSVTSFIRSYATLHLSSHFNFQLSFNIFSHLIRLPADYFAKRHIGDVLSRFTESQKIRQMLTDGVVTVLVDGVMAISTLILMLIYSPLLALISCATLFLYLLIRLFAYSLIRESTEENIVARAEENSNFLETLRAMIGIKTFGMENDRTNIWQNKFVRVINSDVKVGKLNIGFSVAHQFLFGVEMVVVMYIGANLILDNQLSIGMLIAFIAYKSSFLQRGYSIIELFLEFKVLELYLERLSDILLSKKESVGESNPNITLNGNLRCENLSFRYSENEPLILDSINLEIRAGESVAIVGPSGCGKSTLLQLFVGLYKPTSGSLYVDNKKLDDIGLINYRRHIAVVHQNDQLLSGSIEDNICFFSIKPNFEHIYHCAKLAGIYLEVDSMPMKFKTLIGDMGTALSGGQIQRIMLARALYKNPKIIILDEATSHLDTEAEKIVNNSIKELNITRIIVAHRKETILSADRVIRLENGQVTEEG
jgi:ATP-binding cassette subfamily B protein RaxB